jgi:two-component system phosphate regulon sensor histidine kinase PhoR
MSIEVLIKEFPDPAILTDGLTRVLAFNSPAFYLLNNLKRDELISSATRDSNLLRAIENTVEKRAKTSVNITLGTSSGKNIEATIIPIQPELAREIKPKIFIHIRDMSEQERLAKTRMAFIANASHELRTPLASMSGFIETLQTTAREDVRAREEFLGIMAEQAQRMTRLINDLLSLSRLEMNAAPLPDMKVDITATVNSVIDALGPLAEENGVKIKTRGLTEPLHASGDKDELVQAFQNIIINAIRYGAKGGKIIVKAARTPATEENLRYVSISVTDFGPGIDKKHLPRLTERFYRIDKVDSRAKGGTGLGLAIAKHAIERHRGKLKIHSKPGHGATFTITLPEYFPELPKT